MKTKAILITGLLALCATQLIAGEPKGRVLEYGIFKRAQKERIIKTPATPSGVTTIPAGQPILSTTTNRIPARIGIRFGISYEITNLDLKDGEAVEVTKVVTHPPMKRPDGKISETFSVTDKAPVTKGRIEAQCGYGFDHDYELVPGVWQIEIKVAGKTLAKQEFTIFKE